MKNSKRGDAEDEEFEREQLFEIARREAELIRKREIEAEKKKVEAVDIPSEDEEFQIDFDEEENEKQDDDEDDELVIPFDQDAEDEGDDEKDDDEDMEEAEPEAPTTEARSFRRRTQVLKDDEDDDDDNPFASQSSQSKSGISLTQMFQQTQNNSNSQQLKVDAFSSDDDEDYVIPATQFDSSGSNFDKNAQDSICNDSFELESQKKVNFDFDTDIMPTQLSQFPEPTQVSMIQRPDMMDIVEGLRRPDNEKPGLRRKTKLSDDDTHDNAPTQADLDSSMTQAIPDCTIPIGFNNMTQKIFSTVPETTQNILGSVPDTQAIPYFETQKISNLSANPNVMNHVEKAEESDESDSQRIIIKRHKNIKPVKEKKYKDNTIGRELADEEAVESEDEWAGMGGNSDDDIDPEMAEELKKMVDDDETGINKSKDEAALQKLFASKKRNEDQEIEGLLKDVVTGDWRKKKAKGGLLDLSDDDDGFEFDKEDDIETQKYNRRLKRAMERRKRKLLENDKLAAMKNDPKKQSFMKVIEGENSFMDTKKYFADADSSDDELEIVDTQSAEDTQEEVNSQSVSREPSIAMPPPVLFKNLSSVSSTIIQRPIKKRRSEVEYIRQTLSFLDEDKLDHNSSDNEDGSWDPSRTLNDAIDPEQLISDDDDVEDSLLQEETLLGAPLAYKQWQQWKHFDN
ncbi:hypothetical protein D0Z03_000618 [Geotrichum reessii]|nr:hypothetical protein D0Z03_000618 [Galactomyces reessii]